MNNYLRLSSAAIQMGVVIGLSAWGGNKLDQHWNNKKPIFTIILSLIGIAAGLYLVLKEVKNLNDKNEK